MIRKLCSSTIDKKTVFRLSAVAALLLGSVSVQAVDLGGLEIMGYTRGGFASSANTMPRGGYTLGGDMQKYRLGNEGDIGFELEIKKTFDMGNGLKWSVDYMPTVWNGVTGTDQAYAEMSGLDFAPEAKFWAGQRRLRIQDVHIVDKFFMDYGLNTGAGVTNVNLGFARLGAGIFTGGSINNKNSTQNNARRFNLDLSDIHSNEGGVLRVLGSVVSGNFLYGKPGASLSVSHNQSDFLVKGLTNTVFLQTSSGHADMNGQFQGLGDASTVATNAGILATGQLPGMNSTRIGESINWQTGKFGGQALIALQNGKIEGGPQNGINTRDTTLGGRISYAITNNFKLLAEAGSTARSIDGQANQTLNKFTFAPTLAMAPDFWSRPEMRFYVTRASWNAAAATANAGTFGLGGRTSATTAGVQIEAWW